MNAQNLICIMKVSKPGLIKAELKQIRRCQSEIPVQTGITDKRPFFRQRSVSPDVVEDQDKFLLLNYETFRKRSPSPQNRSKHFRIFGYSIVY